MEFHSLPVVFFAPHCEKTTGKKKSALLPHILSLSKGKRKLPCP
jgi:hypothetical protein